MLESFEEQVIIANKEIAKFSKENPQRTGLEQTIIEKICARLKAVESLY